MLDRGRSRTAGGRAPSPEMGTPGRSGSQLPNIESGDAKAAHCHTMDTLFKSSGHRHKVALATRDQGAMVHRKFTLIDQLLIRADALIRPLRHDVGEPRRPSPAIGIATADLPESARRHAAGLMRVNHSGEVCAQGLYHGQALTARLEQTRRTMERAAEEEQDHLAWCAARIRDLGSDTSALNALWYGLSFGLGAAAGLVSDRLSLGFVAATEDQVCQHLAEHLEQLPSGDQQSRAIVEAMLIDERKHAQTALAAGGIPLPQPVKVLMSLVAKSMTKTSYLV